MSTSKESLPDLDGKVNATHAYEAKTGHLYTCVKIVYPIPERWSCAKDCPAIEREALRAELLQRELEIRGLQEIEYKRRTERDALASKLAAAEARIKALEQVLVDGRIKKMPQINVQVSRRPDGEPSISFDKRALMRLTLAELEGREDRGTSAIAAEIRAAEEAAAKREREECAKVAQANAVITENSELKVEVEKLRIAATNLAIQLVWQLWKEGHDGCDECGEHGGCPGVRSIEMLPDDIKQKASDYWDKLDSKKTCSHAKAEVLDAGHNSNGALFCHDCGETIIAKEN